MTKGEKNYFEWEEGGEMIRGEQKLGEEREKIKFKM